MSEPAVFDPMATFDATTAYRGDYRFAPGVRRAYRVRPGVTDKQVVWLRQMTLSHPGYPSAAEQLHVQSTEEIWELWKDNIDDDDPREGDRYEVDQLPAIPVLIGKRAGLAHYNRWNVATTRTV